MKYILVTLISFVLSNCYTQIINKVNRPDTALIISDTSVFLPEEDYFTDNYKIKDLYGEWINSREEENSAIKIYRSEDFKEFPLSRFREKIIFYKNGECKYLILDYVDRPKYIKSRWRILKDNPDTINLYDDEGRKNKSFRIEELKENLLKIAWIK